nr:MAG TPA: hypothetical protein [Caudoviricetes sp.]
MQILRGLHHYRVVSPDQRLSHQTGQPRQLARSIATLVYRAIS